jgi:hypothetical protein
MNQNIDALWCDMLPAKYDNYFPYQKLFLRQIAATECGGGKDSELTKLYEQFLTLKTLAGVHHGRD